jgi:hypothetical protein
VITPPVVPGLTLSADYFHIEIENSVASLDPQFIIDNEADFPGLVVRAPASASDVALGIPGTLLLVNTTFQNLGFIEVEGVDGSLEYVMPETAAGTFTLRLEAAYIHSFKQQASAAEPVRELIGTYLRPEFRGRAQLGWRIGGFEAITTFNYIDSYEDQIGDRTVDYDTTVDVLLEYRFGRNRTAAAAAPETVMGDKKMVAALDARRSAGGVGVMVSRSVSACATSSTTRRRSRITQPAIRWGSTIRASVSSSSISRRNSRVGKARGPRVTLAL